MKFFAANARVGFGQAEPMATLSPASSVGRHPVTTGRYSSVGVNSPDKSAVVVVPD